MSNMIPLDKSKIERFSSESWEVEDSYFPEKINNLEVKAPKNFSRSNKPKNELIPFNSFNKINKNLVNSSGSLKAESMKSQPVLNPESWKKQRRNNIYETNSKILSLKSLRLDLEAKKNAMNQCVNEIPQPKSPKKKQLFLGKLFLVKKFIKNLRESTFFRSMKWLSGLHYDIINDWNYFFTKSNQLENQFSFFQKCRRQNQFLIF